MVIFGKPGILSYCILKHIIGLHELIINLYVVVRRVIDMTYII